MKKRDYSKGCGTSMGQNESCVEGYLCDACRAAIAAEKRENALVVQSNIMRDALEDIIRACSSGILTTGDIERIAKEALKKVQ
jgi:hypothetical protein